MSLIVPETGIVEVHMAGSVFTDFDGGVLLLRNFREQQWQLPAGEVQPGEPPLGTAAREALEKLDTTVTAAHKLGQAVFRQGGVDFFYEWFRVTEYEGAPMLSERENYDKLAYHNLLRRDIGSLGVSGDVMNLAHVLQEGEKT